MKSVMTAQVDGQCESGGDKIFRGEQVEVDGGYCSHVKCAEEAGLQVPR